ncbi:MAG: Alkaline phosphatase [Verrucomicrobiales bacterium]|nr:Alkaline phosphatase [Verrucomicrobiales bacterium]
MKTASLLLAFPLMLPVCTTHAGPRELKADGRYQFLENGRPASYVIAKDEVVRRSNASRIFLSAQDNLRSVQATARQLSVQTGDRVDLVAYPEGKPPSSENRRAVSRSVVLKLADGVDPLVVASAVNALSYRSLPYAPGHYALKFADSQSALSAAEDLKGIEGISSVTVELAKKYYPKALPAFTDKQLFFETTDQKGQVVDIWYDFTNQTPMEPGVPFGLFDKNQVACYQWYLNNTGQQIDQTAYYPASTFGSVGGIAIPPPLPGIYIPDRVPQFATPNDYCTYNSYFDIYADIRALNAWSQTTLEGVPIDGTGVRVAVMDDGVQINHEDLNAAALLDRVNSYNFVKSNGIIDKTNTDFRDPSPVPLGNFTPNHGTAVAGIAVGRANGKGGVGVAYGAKLSGFSFLLLEASTVADMLTWGADRLEPRPDDEEGSEWRRNQPKFDVAINSWGASTSGSGLNDEELYIKRALAYGALRGRDGKGVIYLFPAGNEGATHGNSNYSYLSNSIYSLHVGSVTDMGRRVLHSSPGASVHVVAPSAGYEMMPAILRDGAVFPTYPPVVPSLDNFAQRSLGYTVTPDDYDGYTSPAKQARTRNTQYIIAPDSANKAAGGGIVTAYNHNFAGTSASTAMVGGVAALMLQANPNLGWRDVQEILMRSATVVDPLFGEWSYNALGMPMSHKYGAGLVNAGKAVAMAKIWRNLGDPGGTFIDNEYQGEVKPVSGASQKGIPDNNPAGVVLDVDSPSANLRVEQIRVKVKINHTRRGDLGIVLSAPRTGQADAEYGVESHLYIPHREDSNADIEYDFTTVRHWGTRSDNPALIPSEQGAGDKWKLKIWDNNKYGKVGVAGTGTAVPPVNPNSTKIENGVYVERVIMPLDNNSGAGKIISAEVHYYGTYTPNENLAPVIEGERIVGRPGKTLYYPVKAITDLSPVEGSTNALRAPILSYRFRVLGNKVSGQKSLFTSPNNILGWANAFPTPEDETKEYPSFRFGLQDGVLTNVLTPSFTPAYQFVLATGKSGETVLTSTTGTEGLKPGMYVVGKGIGSRVSIVEVKETTITLSAGNLADVDGIVRFTDQGPSTGTKGESTVKVPSTDGLKEGLYVYGTNTGVSARIASINTQTKLVTLTAPNVDDVNEVLFFSDIEYFWEPNLVVKATGMRNQNKIVVDDITWIRQGQYVGGLGIAPGSKVSNIDTATNTVTLTQSLTADVKGDKDGKGEVLFNSIRMFDTLQTGEWTVEASATNIFGTTRRRLTLEIRDKVRYDEWKNTYYPPITDPEADPDGDGKVNLIEFISGGDPYVAEPGEFITTSVVDGKPVISYTLDSNALSPAAQPQISSDLSTWLPAVTVAGTKTGSLVNYTVTLDSNQTRQFFRIKVEL